MYYIYFCVAAIFTYCLILHRWAKRAGFVSIHQHQLLHLFYHYLLPFSLVMFFLSSHLSYLRTHRIYTHTHPTSQHLCGNPNHWCSIYDIRHAHTYTQVWAATPLARWCARSILVSGRAWRYFTHLARTFIFVFYYYIIYNIIFFLFNIYYIIIFIYIIQYNISMINIFFCRW